MPADTEQFLPLDRVAIAAKFESFEDNQRDLSDLQSSSSQHQASAASQFKILLLMLTHALNGVGF